MSNLAERERRIVRQIRVVQVGFPAFLFVCLVQNGLNEDLSLLESLGFAAIVVATTAGAGVLIACVVLWLSGIAVDVWDRIG